MRERIQDSRTRNSRNPIGMCPAFLWFVMCLVGLPAAAEESQGMDCGALWLGGAEARIRTTVSRGLYPVSGQEVAIEVHPDAFGRPGNKALHVAVLQCIPAPNGGTLKPVSSFYHTDAKDITEVRFSLPENAGTFQQFRFHVYLSKKQPWKSGGAVHTNRVRPFGRNLVLNHDFQYVADVDPTNPFSWYVEGEKKRKQFQTFSGLKESGMRDGTPIRMRVSGPSTARDSIPAPRVTLAEPIQVVPGSELHLRTRAWIRSATGSGLQVEVRYRDGQGNPVGEALIQESNPGEVTDGIETFESWGRVPAGAVTATVRATMRENIGTTDLAEISLLPGGMEAPADAVVLDRVLEEGARVAKPLSLPKGAESRVYDLGPHGSRVANGFLPLAPLTGRDSGVGAGFVPGTAPWAFGGNLPEALTEDGILLGRSTLELQASDGKWWLWVLMGHSGDVETMPVSRDALQVDGTSVTVIPPPHVPVNYHLEREDDAVNELNSNESSIFNAYVLPRYTQIIQEVSSNGNPIRITCAEGESCPIVAIGLISRENNDFQTLEQSILGVHSRRKVAFQERWALAKGRPVPPSEDLQITNAEEERGFLPFIPLPGMPVMPGTVPKREAVRQALNGVHLSVTPGSRAMIRLGVFPLKFRRQAQVSITEPINAMGESIPGADWRVRLTRYRAFRPEFDHGNYALGADLLEEDAPLSIRPGVSRTLWFDSEISDKTPPGIYVGAVRIQAGRSRFVEMPFRIEVLPFRLPEPNHGHGTSIHRSSGLSSNVLRHVHAVSFPITSPDSNQLIPEVETVTRVVQQVGPEIQTIFLTPEFRFSRSSVPGWMEMLKGLRSTASERQWPRLVLVASAFEKAGLSKGELSELCGEGLWECAEVSSNPPSGLRDRGTDINWVDESALTQALAQPSTAAEKLKSAWLFDVGCGRWGKGLLSWAFQLEGALCQSGDGLRNDPLDAWGNILESRPIDHLMVRGNVAESERFLLGQEGIQDAQFMVLLEQIHRRGKDVIPDDQRESIGEFISETRDAIRSGGEFGFYQGVALHWPIREDFRERAVELLKVAWDTLQNAGKDAE